MHHRQAQSKHCGNAATARLSSFLSTSSATTSALLLVPHKWLQQSFRCIRPCPRPPYCRCHSPSPMFWQEFKTRTGAMKRRACSCQIPCTDSYAFLCFQEDQECPLCLEEMDISDLNFKPCVCGYQVRSSRVVSASFSLPVKICRFCWHHIKENLNKRCPACRRIYTDEGVEFKPVATQE